LLSAATFKPDSNATESELEEFKILNAIDEETKGPGPEEISVEI